MDDPAGEVALHGVMGCGEDVGLAFRLGGDRTVAEAEALERQDVLALAAVDRLEDLTEVGKAVEEGGLRRLVGQIPALPDGELGRRQ